MEYRKIGETYYIRMDRGDEVIGSILQVCRKESIPSATFSVIVREAVRPYGGVTAVNFILTT